MAKSIDVTGERYGNLTALKRCGTMKNRNALWLFRCDCGVEMTCALYDAKRGARFACVECAKKTRVSKSITHSMSETDEYSTWADIKTRCGNKNNSAYNRYGGRGIKVCDRWVNSFENFVLDMGLKPSKEHSIDRIDNDKGYSPDNCRWATRQEQARNKRTTMYAEIGGVKKRVVEWIEELGVSRRKVLVLSGLVELKRGSPIEIEFNGITDTILGWSKRTGIKPTTIHMRLYTYKWSIEKSLSTRKK